MGYIRGDCTEQVEVITVKVPAKLKEKMRQVNINWSEYIRQCVQQRIDQERRVVASKKLNEIRKRGRSVSEEELLGWIREGRERYQSVT